MASHSFTIASPLTVQDAFARLVDLERVPEWDDGVRSSVRIESRRSDSVLGSRFDVTVTGFDGSPTTVVYEITEVDEPTRFVMVGENEQFRGGRHAGPHADATRDVSCRTTGRSNSSATTRRSHRPNWTRCSRSSQPSPKPA